MKKELRRTKLIIKASIFLIVVLFLFKNGGKR